MEQQQPEFDLKAAIEAIQKENAPKKEETITISKDVFYSIVDYAHPVFAITTQQELINTAEREGFARRLLVRSKPESAQPSNHAVNMVFMRNDVNKRGKMEEQFIRAQERMHVSEDRALVKLAFEIDESRIMRVKRSEMSGQVVAQARQLVTNRNIPVFGCLVGSRFYSDHIIGDPQMRHLFDPSTKIESVVRGNMGHLMGMAVFSDAFRHPEHRVINQDACIFFGPAEYVGSLCVNEGQIPTITPNSSEVSWELPYESTVKCSHSEALSLLIVED